VYRWFWASTLHGVGPLPSHVVMISLVPSCICHVRLSKRMPSSITLMFNLVWKFLPQWRMSSLTLELENVLSHFEYPTWVAGLRRMSNEAQNKQSHEAQSDSTRWDDAHAQKKKLHERLKRSPPSNGPTILVSSWAAHPTSFLVSPPPFVNLRMRFLLRGEGCNTPCY
jgi:hypothetical protein